MERASPPSPAQPVRQVYQQQSRHDIQDLQPGLLPTGEVIHRHLFFNHHRDAVHPFMVYRVPHEQFPPADNVLIHRVPTDKQPDGVAVENTVQPQAVLVLRDGAFNGNIHRMCFASAQQDEKNRDNK